MCFDYCCGFFEEVKHVASEIIDQRDLLVSEVYEAQEQYLIASALGAVLSPNPTVAPLFIFFAVLVSSGGMAAGTVAAALAPVLAGVGTTMLILPDNDAGTSGKVAARFAAPVALGGVYMATTAGGASGSEIMCTLAGWGGGTLAAGGGGAASGVVAIGGVAALAVVAVGVGVWGTVEIADYMTVLSANPTVPPFFLFFAVLGGVGIVAVGARRLRSVSML